MNDSRARFVLPVIALLLCACPQEQLPPLDDDLPEENAIPVAVVRDMTVSVGALVRLSGLESHDPEGAQLDYSWALRLAPPLSTASLVDPTAAIVEFTCDRAGIYVVDLVVDDGSALSAPTTAIVVAQAGDEVPTADAGSDSVVRVGATVEIDGSGSVDPDGAALVFAWRFVSIPGGSTAMVDDPGAPAFAFRADFVGDYVLELVVHNGAFGSPPDRVTVTARDAAPNRIDDVAIGLLDPREVYLLGTTQEGLCGRDAIAHWSEPDIASAGFDCYVDERTGQIDDLGALHYMNTFENVLRAFVCDGCPTWSPTNAHPNNVLVNDPILATPPCDPDTNRLASFLFDAGGDRIHRCTSSYTWYDEAGLEVLSSSSALAFNTDLVLTNAGLVTTYTGAVTPMTGLPPGGILAARGQGTGFMIALDQVLGPELWEIDTTGAARYVGTFSDPPIDHSPQDYTSVLDAEGRLYQFASLPGTFDDTIIRRSIDLDSEVVYTEATNPGVKIHISGLVTGG